MATSFSEAFWLWNEYLKKFQAVTAMKNWENDLISVSSIQWKQSLFSSTWWPHFHGKILSHGDALWEIFFSNWAKLGKIVISQSWLFRRKRYELLLFNKLLRIGYIIPTCHFMCKILYFHDLNSFTELGNNHFQSWCNEFYLSRELLCDQ